MKLFRTKPCDEGAAIVQDTPRPTTSQSKHRRAWEQREGFERSTIAPYFALGGGEDYVMKRRWENSQEHAKDYPAIADIVDVQISHTSDTGQLVVSLRDVDGKRVSFWCNGANGGPVRSITGY